MAYDQKRQQVVVFGGVSWPASPVGDTWIWDGARWSQKHPQTAPPPGGDGAMAYDQNSEKVILYGAGNHRDETWAWDGGDWTRLQPAVNPGNRPGFLMAWDPVRRMVLLQGGMGDQPNRQLFDTWGWDGSNWKKLDVTAPPHSASDGAMAYDPVSGRMLRWGEGRTWLLESDRWVELPGSSPSPPASGPAVWTDAGLGRVVLFGGSTGAVAPRGVGVSDGMWSWNGTRWEPLQSGVRPSPRWGPGAVFDQAHGSALLFGGTGEDRYQNQYALDDTWTWQANGWRQVVPLRARPKLRALFVVVGITPLVATDVFHLVVAWPDGKREEADLWGGASPPCGPPLFFCGRYAVAPRDPDPGGGSATYTVTRTRGGVETVIQSGPVDILHGQTYYIEYRA